MGRITILPDTVADQIAAGEVVERPASVVKELVENALDAGASAIRVSLSGGGRSRIEVTDDGAGMEREDAVLALDRHATSKIRHASDLVGVATYGFRGEALPAIASVSQFVLETAPSGNGGPATRLTVRGGRLEAVDDTARQPGTTVIVERLFFNTPARRKFLRSQRAETRAVSEALTLLALARLDVSFRLESDGRTLLDAPRASAIADRVHALFGEELAHQLIPVEYAAGTISVHGLIQRPADARPSGRKAYLFINGRPFRDHFLVRAAETGYRGAVHPGARPTLLLSLSVPGEAVDVNVHPAKLEVRFRDKYAVERAVEAAVREALGPLAAAATIETPGASAYGGGAESWAPPHETPDMPAASLFTTQAPAAEPDRSAPTTGEAPGLGPLLQVFDTWILHEMPDGLSIIDQHSAHERILFEGAMEHLTRGGGASQRLLLPLTLAFGPDELDAIERHGELLNAVGYEVEPFGGNSVVVHAVPSPHRRFDARRCFEELVADLSRGRFGGMQNRLERFAATYACRAAVKAGDRLAPEEMRELLRRLFTCELPPHDVHGRPTIVRLPRAELERRFGRT